jgi:hypothetical protein
MNKLLFKEYNNILKSVVLLNLATATDFLNALFGLNFPLLRYFFAMAGVFFFLRGIFFTKKKLQSSGHLVKYSFYALALVTLVMIARGMPLIWEGNGNYVNLKLFISGQLFMYLFPFIIFSEPNEYLLKKLLKINYKLSALYLLIVLILFVFFINNIALGGEAFGAVLVAGASVLFLTQSYHSSKVKKVIVISFILVLFINILFARRNQVLYFSSIIFFYILINLFSKSNFVKRRKSILVAELIIASIFISGYIVAANSQFSYFVEKSQTGMDSRQYVIDQFLLDFDAHPNDYIIGRGMNGTVMAGAFDKNNITGERAGIENGYLQNILVGGGIYLGLIMLISIGAIYFGFFRSKNLLSKAFAAIVATYFVDMIGFGLPTLTMKHFMLWMAVSVCYSAKIRSYSDEYLKSVVGIK